MERPGESSREGDDTLIEGHEGTETLDDRPAARPASVEPTPPSGSGSASAGATTVSSPAEAMLQEEIARTRLFIRSGWPLGVVSIAALPFMHGDVVVRWIFGVSVAVAIGYGVVLDRVFRDPARFSHSKLIGLALSLVAVATSTLLYFGYFSPAAALIALGLYFLGRTEAAGFALVIFSITVGLQIVLGVIIIGGVIDDPGLFPVRDTPLFEQIITVVLVHMVYVLAYLLARWTRQRTLAGIEELERATRKVAQREAQLIEARADLDRALQIGGPGRFTDHTFGGYKVGVIIGRGAMGEVYEAVHVDTGRVAAIKLLHPSALGEPRAVARFLREVQAASALDSPYVVEILDASDPLEPVPYLVMERLHGQDLAHYLRKRTRRKLSDLVELTRQIGSVADAARERGIVHRDLKPQNLFLADQPGDRPLWKVLDFGVSRLAEHTGTLTHGHVVGTPAYMAPEQARGQSVDHRADLYAIAAIAYRWVTGRPPFAGRDTASLLYEVVHRMPQRPTDFADAPADIDAVLAVGLAKRPEDRFASGRELAAAMAAAADGALGAPVRARADALLARLPWGAIAAPAE